MKNQTITIQDLQKNRGEIMDSAASALIDKVEVLGKLDFDYTVMVFNLTREVFEHALTYLDYRPYNRLTEVLNHTSANAVGRMARRLLSRVFTFDKDTSKILAVKDNLKEGTLKGAKKGVSGAFEEGQTPFSIRKDGRKRKERVISEQSIADSFARLIEKAGKNDIDAFKALRKAFSQMEVDTNKAGLICDALLELSEDLMNDFRIELAEAS